VTELFDLYRDMNKRMLEAQQAALKTGEAMLKAQVGVLKAGKASVDVQKALAQAAEANQASWRAFLALTGLNK
jgi:rubrerythrin